MISKIKTLKSITLWRVGRYAEGPGRHPKVPIAVVASNNQTGWAFDIRGDSRFDGTNLPGVSPRDAEGDAQAAVVDLIESASGRDVHANWVQLDADTWRAAATFTN